MCKDATGTDEITVDGLGVGTRRGEGRGGGRDGGVWEGGFFGTGSSSTCPLLYARSHLREPQNAHAIISTKILKDFIFE